MGFWEKAILKKIFEGEALIVAKAAFPLELPLQATLKICRGRLGKTID